MSWQDYVDNQLIASQCVSRACIAGHDGGVWAKSDGFDVSWISHCVSEICRQTLTIRRILSRENSGFLLFFCTFGVSAVAGLRTKKEKRVEISHNFLRQWLDRRTRLHRLKAAVLWLPQRVIAGWVDFRLVTTFFLSSSESRLGVSNFSTFPFAEPSNRWAVNEIVELEWHQTMICDVEEPASTLINLLWLSLSRTGHVHRSKANSLQRCCYDVLVTFETLSLWTRR